MTRLIANPGALLAILIVALVGCENGSPMKDGKGGSGTPSGGRGGNAGSAAAGSGGGAAGSTGAAGVGGGAAGAGGGAAGSNAAGSGGSAGASAGGTGGAAGSGATGGSGGAAGSSAGGSGGLGGAAGTNAAGGTGGTWITGGRGGTTSFGGAAGGLAGSGGSGGANPDPARVGFHLVQVSAIASPLPDPTGVAADATGLWIFRGGQNSTTATLVHFIPSTGVTDKTFALGNLIEQAGTGAYGITYDGTSIWITVAGNTNKLVVVDPNTGQITRTMSSPTNLGPSDLDFDGTDLWLSTGTGMIFSIDPRTGGIKKQYATSPTSLGRDNGIAYREGQLWVGEMFGGMVVQSASTGDVLTLATHADGSSFRQQEMGPTCFVGRQLVMVSGYGIRTFDTVPTTPTP